MLDISTVAFYTWFSCSLVISILASLTLLLLLISALRQNNLRTGSRILLFHLMAIQLLICAGVFPIQFINMYQRIGQNKWVFECPPFMLFAMGAVFTENWASGKLAPSKLQISGAVSQTMHSVRF